MLTFGSVCSGIEAASVAFQPLGWRAAWFSEIEPFLCAVLAHHHPDVPNLGDMTTIRGRLEAGEIDAPDLLCGGTPCQSFSVAGLRRSLADDRGNLSLEFIRIANAIDDIRRAAGRGPAWILWENVPGVLSTADNAFGAFLGGLGGCESALDEPQDGWPGAGVVAGPQRVVAWRTLDAQFFGVAQRRRRVFVLALAGPGGWACADALLPVGDRLLWHPAPSRGPGQAAAAGTLRSTDGGSDVDHARAGHLTADVVGSLTASAGPRAHGFGDFLGNQSVDSGHLVAAFGGNRTSGPIDVAPALLAQPGSGYKGDFESETFIAQAFKASHFARGKDGAPSDLAPPLSADADRGDQDTLLAVAIHENQRAEITINDTVGALNSGGGKPGQGYPAVAFLSKDHGADASDDLAHTLDQAQGQAIAFNWQNGGGCGNANDGLGITVNGSGPLTANQTPAVAFQASQSGMRLGGDTHQTLDAHNGSRRHHGVLAAMQVRRLTPVECARLQGFPDDYLMTVTWRGKCPPPDGPMYKALGNSWAVPVVRWIGEQIAKQGEAAC